MVIQRIILVLVGRFLPYLGYSRIFVCLEAGGDIFVIKGTATSHFYIVVQYSSPLPKFLKDTEMIQICCKEH